MASDDIQFSLTGLDELLGKFEEVSFDARRRGGRSSLRRAAQIIETNLRNNAEQLDDKETGRSIADNVALRWNGRRFKRTGDLGFRVGILYGALTPSRGEPVSKSTNAPTPHWRLLEFGTEHMAAQPFARKALSERINEITNTFVYEYSRAMDRAIRRAGKVRAQTL